ncbi:MAG: DnaA/Hda family protein, partial [Gammaproteobacteria bacterium]|nr:DnaA/Hda family protein [Gammaproteobacteria bacterium]
MAVADANKSQRAELAQQLALPVQLPIHASFKTFVGAPNESAVGHLAQLNRNPWRADQQFTLLVGSAGTGKSHLLCALCEQAAELGQQSIYLPLSELNQPEAHVILQGLENYDLIVLDDIDQVSADRGWAEALFAFINRLSDQRQSWLVMSANQGANTLNVALADLRSRLQLAVTFKLQPLPDDGKLQALQLHAKMRGLGLPREVGEFLLLRVER